MAYKTPGITSEYIREIMGEEEHPLLSKMIIEADELRIPILLPESAAFTKQLTLLHSPKNVLEIGTAIGYSGCIFLLNSDCRLTTIDKNEEYLEKARENFKRAGCIDRCEIICGNADEIIPCLSKEYDFILLDGPKAKYIKYLPYLKNLLSNGGVLLADNVLFNGMVASKEHTESKKKSIVKNLDLFLRELYKDKDFMTSILEVGDGMSLSIKVR